LNAREEERINLARDLHDDVLNYLSVMLMEIDGPISLETMRAHCQVVTNRLRETIYELRPSMLNYGLYLGLQEYAEDLQNRVGEKIEIVFDLEEDDCRYPREVETHIFRIVQESCENSLKHASPQTVRISGIMRENEIDLAVEDDGKGFDIEEHTFINRNGSQKHLGVDGMRERAVLIGAQLEIHTVPGGGTWVEITWKEGHDSTSG
jgi:signal transduction histidine kinase